MAKTMTKSATVAYLAEKTSLTRKQIEGILEERRVPPAGLREAGAGEPQGADRS